MTDNKNSVTLKHPTEKLKKILNLKVSDGIISLGKRGAGKTTLVEFLIESLSPDFEFAVMDVVGNLAKFKDYPNVKYYLINPHNRKEVDDVFVDALSEGGLMLVLDEADRYSLRDKSVLSDAVNVGRNYLVGYIATARRCVEENEYVYTPKGVIKAKDLIEGQIIFGGFIKGNNKFEDDAYELTVGRNKVVVNGEHPFWVRKGSSGRYPKAQWVTAKEIFEHNKESKYKWYIQEYYSDVFPVDSISVGNDFAKLLGYLMSDGYISNSHGVRFTNTNKVLLQDVINLSSSYGFKTALRTTTGGFNTDTQAYDVSVSSMQNRYKLLPSAQFNLRSKLRELEIIGQTKTFGKIQLLLQDELFSFISGYFNGDGTLNVSTKYPSIEFYVGISETQAIELQFMLWRLGIFSSYYHRKSTWNNGVGTWIVKVSDHSSVYKLVTTLDTIKYPEKFERAKTLLESVKSKRRINDDARWVEVSKVIPVGKKIMIGWETIPTHEIILKNGIKSHNTANIDKDFLSNADWSFVFKHTLPQDIDVLIQWFNSTEEDFKGLERYEFLLFHSDEPVFKGKIPYEGETEVEVENKPLIEKLKSKEPESDIMETDSEDTPEEQLKDTVPKTNIGQEPEPEKKETEILNRKAEEISQLGLEQLAEIEGVGIFGKSDGFVEMCKYDQWFKEMPVDTTLDEAKEEVYKHLHHVHENKVSSTA